MKTFRSLEEVESAGLSPPVYAAVHGVKVPDDRLQAEAVEWQATRGGRSGLLQEHRRGSPAGRPARGSSRTARR